LVTPSSGFTPTKTQFDRLVVEYRSRKNEEGFKQVTIIKILGNNKEGIKKMPVD
jgi:hypothetical protein